MKAIVGLGNPGKEYCETRHNVGFMVVDEIAQQRNLRWRSKSNWDLSYAKNSGEQHFFVVKPETFMNRSGWAVSQFAAYYDVAPKDLLVIVDDVDLPLGKLRVRARGSAGTHKGLKSCVEQLGTIDFPRLRVGVGRGDSRHDLADYVLAKFDQAEWPEFRKAITRAADAAQMFVVEDIQKVMNTYNPETAAPEID